ncbi:hypothetical protein N657DRAFT_320025 [Parathielavia appendiculata]|uniref:Uncharacterized protein n=1 Tax=Parathielavia appendiculata TaxID=2587402 RepID=A0AAN6YYQ2_9PEZI|nr:hypothetical protein N657DRAFT_320025 [Parathielavia appendiculata]
MYYVRRGPRVDAGSLPRTIGLFLWYPQRCSTVATSIHHFLAGDGGQLTFRSEVNHLHLQLKPNCVAPERPRGVENPRTARGPSDCRGQGVPRSAHDGRDSNQSCDLPWKSTSCHTAEHKTRDPVGRVAQTGGPLQREMTSPLDRNRGPPFVTGTNVLSGPQKPLVSPFMRRPQNLHRLPGNA